MAGPGNDSAASAIAAPLPLRQQLLVTSARLFELPVWRRLGLAIDVIVTCLAASAAVVMGSMWVLPFKWIERSYGLLGLLIAMTLPGCSRAPCGERETQPPGRVW